jgi:hypothetical protein
MRNNSGRKNGSQVEKALESARESRTIDFKQQFDVTSKGEWCEMLKDIVAMANSGGGILVVGVDDDGKPAKTDLTRLTQLDPAALGDKIASYTGIHFSDFQIIPRQKQGAAIVAIEVGCAETPLVFTSPGDYQKANGKPGSAFAKGTVYFRHGAKSEPGTTDDLRHAFDRLLKSERREWFKGVKRIAKAPRGATIKVLPPGVVQSDSPDATRIRVVDDPTAPGFHLVDPDKSYPYRQKDLIELVNQKIPKTSQINSFDILCVRRAHGIDGDKQYFYKSHFASPQYSEAFANWIIQQHTADPKFFKRSRKKCKKKPGKS